MVAALANFAWSQTTERPWQKLFGGPATPKKVAPAPPVREEGFRLVEIFVELAWLGDPLTFPYYLEARVEGASLHVRGNLPSQAVREHAVKLARLNSPVPVVDDFKENPNLTGRSVRMAPDKLQVVVRSALKESLPRQAKSLEVRCSVDGRVAVSGNVASFEEKLSISQALRRLHGCTVVTNLARVASDPDNMVARNLIVVGQPTTTAQVVAPADQVLVMPGPGDVKPGVVVMNPAPASQAEPITIQILDSPAPQGQLTGLSKAVTDPAAAPRMADGPRLTIPQLKRRIEQICPNAKEVKLTQTAANNLRVEIQFRDGQNADAIAGQVLSLPEMQPYQVDLRFVMGQ